MDGHPAVVHWLDGRGRPPLWLAASRGQSAAARVLAENGANVLQLCDGMSACYAAAGLGFVGTVRVLAQAGADIDKPDKLGITPVSIACHGGHRSTVELLASLGADLVKTSIVCIRHDRPFDQCFVMFNSCCHYCCC
eukprot:SAG31_NODE_225_length_19846_cov_19.057983_3_plen_137_part_00